jgi:flagellar protein FliO/FliZ
MLWALLVVLGLVFAAAWIIRKSRMLPGASSSGIRIVAQQWLSTRERLLLVEVGKEQVLIGVSPQGMVLLHQLDEPVPVDDQTTDTGGKRFASELQRLLGKSDPRNPESPT